MFISLGCTFKEQLFSILYIFFNRLEKEGRFSAHFMSNIILIYKFYNNIKTENNRSMIHSIAPYVNVPERFRKTHTKVVTVPKANGIGAGNFSLMCKV